MRRSSVLVVTLIAVLLLGATGVFYAKYHKANADYAQLKTEDDNTRARYGQAIADISMIQDSLNAIVLGTEEAKMIPAQLESEMRLSENRGDEAMAKIAVLKAGIERTKAKIEDLNATLEANGVKIEGLEKMIHSLRRSIAQREVMIAHLTTTVDSLTTTVTGLTADVEDKKRELGTIFYAMGNKKALTTSGVLVAKGGVLGIGKTLTPSREASEGAFTALNTDEETVIPIPAKKAQVVSAQPSESYVLAPSVDGFMELRITDPKEFRKIKHLVIVTAA
jgi:peptidoglycan hydrolase CwlO-like protein